MKRHWLKIMAVLAIAASFLHPETRWLGKYLVVQWRQPTSVTAAPPWPALCPGCNLLMVSLDTLRADRLGVLGGAGNLTPNLDMIASQSYVFTRAYANAYFTTPSHMTLFTSLHPATHGVESRFMRSTFTSDQRTPNTYRSLDANYLTLAQVLADKGYRGFWNGPLKMKYFNFDDGFGRGFHRFDESPFARGFAVGGYAPNGFRAASVAPLVGREPAFVFMHSYVNHSPYLDHGHIPVERTRIPVTREALLDPFRERALTNPETVLFAQMAVEPSRQAERERVVKVCTDFTDLRECFEHLGREAFWHAVGQYQTVRSANVLERTNGSERFQRELTTLKAAYDNGVVEVDRQVGALWSELQRTGALNNTVVVFVSDHGEELFEHGGPSHFNFYEHTARVPLIIYNPKQVTPVRTDQLVSLVDVMPMILDILGVPKPAQVQGRSPWTQPAEFVFGQTFASDFVRDDQWKVIREQTGAEQLFHLPTDPEEQHNLMDLNNPIVRRAFARLAAARERWRMEQAL